MSETIAYVEPAEAVEILAERLANPRMVDSVRRYLGDELPDDRLLGAKPAFIRGDYVARGTCSDLSFARDTVQAGGTPYWATYDDAYSRTNPAKAAIVQPMILLPDGRITQRRIVSKDDPNGGMMSRRTIFGSTLADYHAMLRQAVFLNAKLDSVQDNVFDIGPWYVSQARRFGYVDGERLATSYVVARTALGVLCAQSVTYEKRHYASGFMDDVVLPAICKVREDLNLEPVFVRRPNPPLADVINLNVLENGRARVSVEESGSRKHRQVAVKEVRDS